MTGAWLAAAAVVAAGAPVMRVDRAQAPARTTKDGVFTKAQAEAGKAVFDKVCTACHGFAPSAKSANNPDLAGEAFLANWLGKSVKDLQTMIRTTMPNDGSATLEEPQVIDVVAFILEQNGFSAGKTLLGGGPAAAAITIAK